MESYFDKQAKYLYNKAEEIINTYAMAIENEEFVELYFESYSMIRG